MTEKDVEVSVVCDGREKRDSRSHQQLLATQSTDGILTLRGDDGMGRSKAVPHDNSTHPITHFRASISISSSHIPQSTVHRSLVHSLLDHRLRWCRDSSLR